MRSPRLGSAVLGENQLYMPRPRSARFALPILSGQDGDHRDARRALQRDRQRRRRQGVRGDAQPARSGLAATRLTCRKGPKMSNYKILELSNSIRPAESFVNIDK